MKYKIATGVLTVVVLVLSVLLYAGTEFNRITRMYVVPEQCDIDMVALVEFYGE